MENALLVLDLDETLIYGTRLELDYPFDFRVGPYFIYLRPNCFNFLEEMSQHFRLAIWSSAGEQYVQEIAQFFNAKLQLRFEFVWSRNRATFRRSSFQDEYYYDGEEAHHYYVKRLSKVKKQGFAIERVLILDDSPHKCVENYGNAIYPNVFTGNSMDNELSILSQYLISIKDLENFRKIEKRNWRAFSDPKN